MHVINYCQYHHVTGILSCDKIWKSFSARRQGGPEHTESQSSTVIHRLMVHHPLMIPFCYINNLSLNAYFFMKHIFLEYSTSTLSTIKFWEGLVKFWVYHTLFKNGISTELAESRHTTANNRPFFTRLYSTRLWLNTTSFFHRPSQRRPDYFAGEAKLTAGC